MKNNNITQQRIGKIAKYIDIRDRAIMIDFIDTIRLRRNNVSAEILGRNLAEIMRIKIDLPNRILVRIFENIVETDTKQLRAGKFRHFRINDLIKNRGEVGI